MFPLIPTPPRADDLLVALPVDTTPLLAPDRLAVWPIEGGRYGVDATYQGATGFERAEAQRQRFRMTTSERRFGRSCRTDGRCASDR
jgi:hypothetical protein